MNRPQINKLNMFRTVNQVFVQYESIYQTIPSFVSAVNTFRTGISNINLLSKKTESATTGITMDKNNLKINLINLMFGMAGDGIAFCNENNMQEMRAKLYFNIGEMKRENDMEVYTTCQIIIDELQSVIQKLADFGLVQSNIDALKDMATEFYKSMDSKSNSVSNKGASFKSLAQEFTDTNNVLKKRTDFMMRKFKITHRDFYNAYKLGRHIIDLGGSPSGNKTVATPPTT